MIPTASSMRTCASEHFRKGAFERAVEAFSYRRQALKAATNTIPIVIATVSYPKWRLFPAGLIQLGEAPP